MLSAYLPLRAFSTAVKLISEAKIRTRYSKNSFQFRIAFLCDDLFSLLASFSKHDLATIIETKIDVNVHWRNEIQISLSLPM